MKKPSLNLKQYISARDVPAFGAIHGGDRTVHRRKNFVFHLHGFEDQHKIPGLYSLAFSLFDAKHGSGHRGNDGARAVRRRLLRMERGDSESADEMTVYAPRREISYVIPVQKIADERISELQETFARLIFPAP